MTDQYDAVLRALEPGALIGVNWSIGSNPETPELEVLRSRDDRTCVHATDGRTTYKIYRLASSIDRLVVEKKRLGTGFEHYADVLSIELIGIESGGGE